MDGISDVIETLSRNRGLLFGLLALYFAVNVALRLALPNALELDEGQQLFLAQWLAIGYDTQPPFYNWLQYGVVQVLGDTVLALSLLKNAMLLACYVLVGLTASRLVTRPVLAVIAVLGLLTVPQIVFEAQRDLTHTVAVLFAACLFLHALVVTIQRPTLLHYALTGAAIGIGVISKYNFVLLPIAALIAMLADPGFRRRLFDVRLLVTIVIAAAIVMPHGLWFLDHLQAATGRTLGKLGEDGDTGRLARMAKGLTSLATALVGFSFVTVIVFAAVFGRQFLDAFRMTNAWTRLLGRIFLLLVAFLVALVVFGGASNIKDRWLTPFFFALPLYLALKIDLLDRPLGAAPRRFGIVAVSVMILVPVLLFARVPSASWTGTYKKINVPYQPAIEAILATGKARPALIATADQQMAGNLRLNAPGIPVMIPGYEAFQPPVAFDAAHPLLLVWRDNGKPDAGLPEPLARWHDAYVRKSGGAATTADSLAASDIAKPYHYGRPGDLYHFRYAWIYPPASTP
jgi:4-amino-4-deoxy-L-arabinose transferase-like glycosyltransferase